MIPRAVRVGGLASPMIERIRCAHPRGHGMPASWSPPDPTLASSRGSHLAVHCAGDIRETDADWRRRICARRDHVHDACGTGRQRS